MGNTLGNHTTSGFCHDSLNSLNSLTLTFIALSLNKPNQLMNSTAISENGPVLCILYIDLNIFQ